MEKPLVSPSLLAANFLNLGADIDMINHSEADWIHCDIMDGVFVPNISLGFPVLEAVKSVTSKPLDVHLMVVHPERYLDVTAKLGAMMMTVHQEATVHLDRLIRQIHDSGMKAGVALNPSTPVSMLEDVIENLDMVLLMSVNPGFGGQSFIENTVNKARRLKKLITESKSSAIIEVDGGINAKTAPKVVEAGVDVLVSGSYIFKAQDPQAVIKSLKQL